LATAVISFTVVVPFSKDDAVAVSLPPPLLHHLLGLY